MGKDNSIRLVYSVIGGVVLGVIALVIGLFMTYYLSGYLFIRGYYTTAILIGVFVPLTIGIVGFLYGLYEFYDSYYEDKRRFNKLVYDNYMELRSWFINDKTSEDWDRDSEYWS
jgi:uncharacterized protein YacL